MKSLDRLAEGDGDEPQPETPGTPATRGAVDPTKELPAGTPARGQAPKAPKRRRCDAGTPEMHRRMKKARAARGPNWAKNNFGRRGVGKIDAMLKPEHREEYENLERDPHKTDEDRTAWLKAHDYPIGLHAVRSHRRSFTKSLQSLRAAARFAGNVRALFGEYAPSAMSDVSLTCLQQVLTERLFQPEDAAGNTVVIEIEDLVQLSKMVESAIGARHRVETLRRDFEHKCRAVAAEVDRIAKPGTDGVLVANRVKQLLGIPLGPETEEEAAAAERQYVPFDLAELQNPSPTKDPGAKN